MTESKAAKPVELVDVTKSYGEVQAVRGLSAALDTGSITGILGPNGAGKTTMLRMIGGLSRPTSGSVRLFGLEASWPEARRSLGYMPADPAFLPHLSGRANLRLLAALHGSDAPDLEQTAKTLDLSDDLDRPAGTYSSGMRQKLAVVAALQHRPDVVVLDEPANRLDPLAHRAFCDLVRSVAAQRRTVLLSSHVLAEVEAVCDRILLLRDGRLLCDASVAELRGRAMRTVRVEYTASPHPVPSYLHDAHYDGQVLVGRLPADRPDLIRQILCDPNVGDLTIAPPSLEDVVVDLYAGSAS